LPIPPNHIVIFGRPGSGKSSLAERLGQDFGYLLVRTGELLRAAIRRGDHLGKRVEVHLSKGDLVPDPLIFELLEASLSAPGVEKLLFDGFPRTMGQVALMDQFERRLGFEIETYLNVEVGRKEAETRMTGRRVCPTCGATYHIATKTPKVPEICDIDGSPLERRKDDRMEVVTFRQDLYEKHALPILEHYRTQHPHRFRVVNGEQPFKAVYTEACRALGLPCTPHQ
jgi:adenylate kinase